jgi:hypothetical protein
LPASPTRVQLYGNGIIRHLDSAQAGFVYFRTFKKVKNPVTSLHAVPDTENLRKQAHAEVSVFFVIPAVVKINAAVINKI